MEHCVVRVGNLASTVADSDIKQHFLKLLPTCRPKVYPLYANAATGTYCGIVIISYEEKMTREEAIRILCSVPLIDQDSVASSIVVDFHFLDTTVIAQSHSQPQFDIYFVHGLNGNAYSTFEFKHEDRRGSHVWPRDSLPEALENAGYLGRYHIYGYQSSIFKGEKNLVEIEEAAETLLACIEASRSQGCKRPIYFVCHSLGGLLICQAVLFVMRQINPGEAAPQFHDAFYDFNEFLVKGIVFFGTPFKGSKVAELAEPIAKTLALNTSYLSLLRPGDQQIKAMLLDFEKLRTQPQFDLRLIIFYERLPIKRFLPIIVDRESAKGYFSGEKVRRYPINCDHRKICKFSSRQDDNLDRVVLKPIFRLFQTTIVDKTSGIKPLTLTRRQINSFQRVPERFQPAHLSGPLFEHQNPVAGAPYSTFDTEGSQIDTIDIDGLRQDLHLNIFSIPDFVRPALPETCDWLIRNPQIQQWLQGKDDQILFVRGGQGMGKTVLSKYFEGHIRTLVGDRPHVFVIHIPCKVFGKWTSPMTFILRHVLFHLSAGFPRLLGRLASDRDAFLGQRLNFTYYWQLFLSLRQMASFELFCIVDGLDECINDISKEEGPGIDENLKAFLEKLCEDLGRASKRSHHPSTTKIFFTTRPIRELNEISAQFPRLIYDITAADVEPGVAKMVDADVDALAKAKDLPMDIQEMIAETVKHKAGPMYQLAVAVVRRLWGCTYMIDAKQQYKRELDQYVSRDINTPYLGDVQNIENHASITPQDRQLIASMLKIVVLARVDLGLDDLQWALAYLNPDATPSRFTEYLPASLERIIRTHCTNLLSIEGEGARRVVRVAHQSVRDFFLSLPDTQWQAFSCADLEAGQLFMLELCLRCLSYWSELNIVQVNAEMEDAEKVTQRLSTPFIWYSAWYWDAHLRQIKRLGRIKSSFCDFLRNESKIFDFMYQARMTYTDPPPDSWMLPPVSVFLAEAELDEVIRGCAFKYSQSQHRKTSSLLKWNPFRRHQRFSIDLDVLEEDAKGDTMLHKACFNGSLNLMKILLDHGASGHVWNHAGVTPFWSAVAAGHEEAALLLFKHGQAALEIPNSSRISSLQYTALYGMAETTERLLKLVSNVDEPDHAFLGWNALYVACHYNHPIVVKLLLQNGANACSKTDGGSISLHAAALSNNYEALEEILRLELVPNLAQTNDTGQAPIHVAADNGSVESFQLLSAKTLVMPLAERNWLPIHFAARSGHLNIVKLIDASQWSVTDADGFTPLHLAVISNKTAIVQFLVEQRISVNVVAYNVDAPKSVSDADALGISPLYLSTALQDSIIFRTLLQNGADPSVQPWGGCGMLHHAARSGCVEVVEWLLERGFDAMQPDSNGRTPLHYAARSNSLRVIKLLLVAARSSPDFHIDLADNSGFTIFHHAILSGSTDVANLVWKEEGADPKISTVHNFNAVHFAAESGIPTDFVQEMISAGVAPTLSSRWDGTSLHYAAIAGNLQLLQSLHTYFDGVDTLDICHETPLVAAVVKGHDEVAAYLLEQGAVPLIRNFSGRSIIDFLTKANPSYHRFAQYESATTNESRTSLVQKTIPTLLHRLNLGLAAEQSTRRQEFWILACVFMQLGVDPITRILFEASLVRLRRLGSLSVNPCELCKSSISTGLIHICRTCDYLYLCDKCHQAFRRGKKVRYCIAEHDYLEFGGIEWWNREEGIINDEGETFDSFMQGLRTRWPPQEDV